MEAYQSRLLSVDEIASYPGISSDTVYRWIETHSMPGHRVGRFWKLKKGGIDAWVKLGAAAHDPKQS